MTNTEQNYETQPRRVRERRYGIHGVDHMETEYRCRTFANLQTDPLERHNLINVPAFREQIGKLQKQLFDELEASGGLQIPMRPPAGAVLDDRKLPR